MVGETKFGLDIAFIDCIVEELENGIPVSVFACNDHDAFIEYLSDERNIECDYEQKGGYLKLFPTGWDLDNLPY